MLVRIAWVFPAIYLPRWLSPVFAAAIPHRHGDTARSRPGRECAESFRSRPHLRFRSFSPIGNHFLDAATSVSHLLRHSDNARLSGAYLPLLIRALGVEDDGLIDNEEARSTLAGQ